MHYSAVSVCVCLIACVCVCDAVCLAGVIACEKLTLVLAPFEGGPPEAIQGLNLIMASMTAPYLRDSYFKGLAGLMYCAPQFILTA